MNSYNHQISQKRKYLIQFSGCLSDSQTSQFSADHLCRCCNKRFRTLTFTKCHLEDGTYKGKELGLDFNKSVMMGKPARTDTHQNVSSMRAGPLLLSLHSLHIDLCWEVCSVLVCYITQYYSPQYERGITLLQWAPVLPTALLKLGSYYLGPRLVFQGLHTV